jgi:hypothetical protein
MCIYYLIIYAIISKNNFNKVNALLSDILNIYTWVRGAGVTQIFSLTQAQNLQVKFLVVFISDESLIFVVFF